jgi:hypothetical protein
MQIRIGHGAYSGANRPAWTDSKAKAIDILRDRGVKRDDARKAIKRALAGSHVTVSGGMFGSDCIEVAGFSPSVLA